MCGESVVMNDCWPMRQIEAVKYCDVIVNWWKVNKERDEVRLELWLCWQPEHCTWGIRLAALAPFYRLDVPKHQITYSKSINLKL